MIYLFLFKEWQIEIFPKYLLLLFPTGFPGGSVVKSLPASAAETHSGTLAWEIPCTEEPGRLQSMGPQRVGHD